MEILPRPLWFFQRTCGTVVSFPEEFRENRHQKREPFAHRLDMLSFLRSRTFFLLIIFLSLTLSFYPFERITFSGSALPLPEPANRQAMALPPPQLQGTKTLEEILARRRTVRAFSAKPITTSQVAQLLWAAQGVTSPNGFRTAPSGGGLFPLEIRVLAGNVEGLSSGTYRYLPATHQLLPEHAGDLRSKLIEATYQQDWVTQGAAVFLISGVASRSSTKYEGRGVRFTHLEAGHAAQNLLLQAIALELEAGTIGGLDDQKVRTILTLPAGEEPLYLLVVGYP